MEPKEFGQYLKTLREKAKLTMRKLDSLSGVSQSYISQLERGDRGMPSPDILNKLAEPLGVSIVELMKKARHLIVQEQENRLRTLRYVHNKDTKELLEVLEISEEAYFLLEKSGQDVQLEYLEKLSTLYDRSIGYLLGTEPIKIEDIHPQHRQVFILNSLIEKLNTDQREETIKFIQFIQSRDSTS